MRLWGLGAASRHSRYWSSSQPRGLMPSSSRRQGKQAQAEHISRERERLAGLECGERATRQTDMGKGGGKVPPDLRVSAGTERPEEGAGPGL